MRRFVILSCVLASSAAPAPAQTQAQTAEPPNRVIEQPSPEAAAAERARFAGEVAKLIAGHEQEPAEAVFKNIQFFKGVPAGRLLKIMEMGYARSLGVGCTHCHVEGAWEKDDKPQKQIAREMAGMARSIGTEYLAKIKNLASKQPVVNCTTCHRGQIKPALDLPPAGPPR
jgi:hypothetical protein